MHENLRDNADAISLIGHKFKALAAQSHVRNHFLSLKLDEYLTIACRPADALSKLVLDIDRHLSQGPIRCQCKDNKVSSLCTALVIKTWASKLIAYSHCQVNTFSEFSADLLPTTPRLFALSRAGTAASGFSNYTLQMSLARLTTVRRTQKPSFGHSS